MKLKQLIDTNNWLSVSMTLLSIYPDQDKDSYEEVYNKLIQLNPENSDMEISLAKLDDEKGGWVDVSGYDIKEQQHYAIELTSWSKWLGMKISKETLESFSELKIISHCLYEMTYIGFDEKEIQEFGESLSSIVYEITNREESDTTNDK